MIYSLDKIKGGIIVSCQLTPGVPLHSTEGIVELAQIAQDNGAVGVRIDGPGAVRAVRRAIEIPIIGCYKEELPGKIAYITPTLYHVEKLIEAGADMVAVQYTFERDMFPITKYPIPLIADISSGTEAALASLRGFDAVATTMVGHTPTSSHVREFDYSLLSHLLLNLDIPILAEGLIRTPQEARKTLEYGAWAVVIGAAVNNVGALVRWFVEEKDGIRYYAGRKE